MYSDSSAIVAMDSSESQKQAWGLHTQLLSNRAGELISALDSIEETLGKDFKLEFPQIIVVGDQYAGKSTLLERIAMLQFFPKRKEKGVALCTRMPIQLRLQHMSPAAFKDFCAKNNITFAVNTACVRLRYEGADGNKQQSPFFRLDQVEAEVEKYMNLAVQIKHKGKTGVIEDVLTIEITSPSVPNLTLIDLPGIVAAKSEGEPADIMEQTRTLAEKYLKREHSLILGVINAKYHTFLSQALQLIQQHRKEKQTLGVLTMPDDVKDINDVKDQLDGIAPGQVKLPHGYICVKNHDARKGERLEHAVHSENEWLDQNLPGYRQKNKASGEVLIKRLVQMMCNYIEETWAPLAAQKVQQLILSVQQKIKLLGDDPHTLNLSDVLRECSNLWSSQSEALFKMMQTQIMSVAAVEKQHPYYGWSRGSDAEEASRWKRKKQSIVEAATSVLRSLCNLIPAQYVEVLKKQSSSLRLERFDALHYRLQLHIKSLCNNLVTVAEKRVKKELNYFFIAKDVATCNSETCTKIIATVSFEEILDELKTPLANVSTLEREITSLESAKVLLKENSTFAGSRRTLKVQLQNLHQALQCIQSLTSTDNNNN